MKEQLLVVLTFFEGLRERFCPNSRVRNWKVKEVSVNHGNTGFLKKMVLPILILLSSLLIEACASTSLQTAIQKNDEDLVKELLADGKDVNKSYSEGWTPLLIATRQGNLRLVTILLDKGADIRARNDSGWSALLIASRYGFPDIVECLLDRGAYIHTRTHQDFTPLMLAAWGGHLEVVEILVNTDMRLDVKNKEGKTALYYAALNNREDMVRRLLQKGAQVERYESGGEDLFATAVTLKMTAAIDRENGNLQKAEAFYRDAAIHFEKARPGLLETADSYRKKRNAAYAAAALASLAGLVASYVDLANLRDGNPTYYSVLMPRVDVNQDWKSALQAIEMTYRAMANECEDECLNCRKEADKLKNKKWLMGEDR